MKNVIIVVLIIITITSIGFGIYQLIDTFKIELQHKANLEELTNKYGARETELINKYEAQKTELINKYEAEIKNLSESNIQSSRQYETDIKRMKEDWAQKIEGAAKTVNDKNKTVLAVIRKLQSFTDIVTDKTIETDPSAFIVHNTKTNYKDYSTKVTDTKIELDKCLDDSKETLPTDARDLTLKAMDCYKDALSIWEMEFNNDSPIKERKEESKEETEKRIKLERMRKAKESIFYGNKYPILMAPPYSIMVPEGHLLVPLKAVTAVWAQAAKYINEANSILSRNVK